MTQAHRSSADVIILGGGLVGLSLAAALDGAGLAVTIVDPADPESWKAATFDGRTTAVSSSSMRMLETTGVLEHLAAPGCPIHAIRVADGLQPGGLTFEPGRDGEPLGVMHENRHLRAALLARAEAGANIDLRWTSQVAKVVRDDFAGTVQLTGGEEIRAPLIVAAEGRRSPSREAAGIRMARWSYLHTAIVSTLAHDQPHEHIAYEIFYPSGPFALLPMNDLEDGTHRSAIVWSISDDRAAGLLALGDAAFAAEAQAAMGGFLGHIRLLTPRSSYPLGFHHAVRITDRRLALAGDAAHAIHPIAGQGVNLGFRDAAALAEVLVDGARLGLDLGDRQLLDRYQRWRALDAFSVALATDGLTRLYGVPGKAASAVRRFGMGIVDRLGPLKEKLNAAARGNSGDLPRLLLGEAL
ncbi:FAD-dependent monooxygenase [Sphingomonas sp. LHG3406-1]|uniref:FAD-dependent monooxygenase n=1 Tax=Sphingomonas sp. LHG3406-1 TaxID=2804617 RepID=UPI0026364A6B|nr:FAD-dependent monooxygenase [Sphingomonas sp. LHG3406-1]